MIYLFHGSDADQVRKKAFAWVAAARKKEPNLSYIRLAKEELTMQALEEVTASGGLFVSRLLIVLDDPFPKVRGTEEDETEEDTSSLVEEHLQSLEESNNAILIIAPNLLASKAKKIGANAKAVYAFHKSAQAKRGFNAPLPDALSARSREKLWLELQRSMRAGDAPEMIHGLLHWKARELMEKGSRAWTRGDARKVSRELINLLQASRQGGLPLAVALERFALSI